MPLSASECSNLGLISSERNGYDMVDVVNGRLLGLHQLLQGVKRVLFKSHFRSV